MEIPGRLRSRLPLLILLIAVFLPFSPVVLGGKCFVYTDTFNFFYPLKKTVIEILKAGEMPHWNPLSAGGKPLIGGLQSGAFYPLNFVMILLPFHRGFQVFIVIHTLMAAGLGYRLARRMGLDPGPAFLSGITYGLSGYLVSMANSMSILMVASWLPLQIHLAIDFLERGRWREMALLVIVTAFAFLAGAPVTFAYSAGTVVIFLIVGVAKRARRGERWRGRGALVIALPLLVLGVCAVQFLPAQEFAAYSIRSEGVPFDDAARYSFHPLRIATLVSPHVFGNHAVDLPYRHQVAPQIIILITVYLGVLPLILAPLAFLRPTGRPIFWGCALAVSLLVALGRHLPLYRILYEVVPYFDQFRSPFKALVITTFSMAILAGFGMQELLRPEASRGKGRVVLIAGAAWAAILILIVAISFHLYGRIDAAEPAVDEAIRETAGALVGRSLEGLGVLAAGVALLYVVARGSSRRRIGAVPILLFAAAEMGLCATGSTLLARDHTYLSPPAAGSKLRAVGPGGKGPFRLYRTPPDPWAGIENFFPQDQEVFYSYRTFLLEPNFGTVFGIEQFDSYESAVLFWHSKFQNFLERSHSRERARMIGLFNMRYVISLFQVPNPALTRVATVGPNLHIYENRLAFPRAYVVPRGIPVPDGNEMLARILEGETDFTRSVLVTPPGRAAASVMDEEMRILPHDPEARPSRMIGSGSVGSLSIREASSIRYRPNEVEILLDTPEEGFLVLNDTYHPDWKAWVDGEEVEVRRANYLVRAVPVPARTSTVLFRFEPRSHRAGMAVSLLTLLLLAAVEIFSLLGPGRWKDGRGGV